MKITPQQESELRRKVYEAVGTASVCWEPKPEGVFQTEIGLAVGSTLMRNIAEILGFEIERVDDAHDNG